MDFKLKACPFCGGNPTTYITVDSWNKLAIKMSAYVQCKKCDVFKRVKFVGDEISFYEYITHFQEVIDM